MSDLKTLYDKDICLKMKEKFGYTNVMEIPKVEKIVLKDGKMQSYWGEELSQIVFTLSEPGDQGDVVVRVTQLV